MTMALAYVDHLDSVEALTRFFDRVISEHGLDIYLWLLYALHIYVAVRIVGGVTRWFRKRKAKRYPYRTVVRTQQLMISQSPSPIEVPCASSVPNSAEEDRHSSARKSDDSDVMAFPM